MQSKWEAWVWFTNLWPKKKKKKKITSSKIDLYKFSVLHGMLSTDNNLVMITQANEALGNCVTELEGFKGDCELEPCDTACKAKYEKGAQGWCSITVIPRVTDACVGTPANDYDL